MAHLSRWMRDEGASTLNDERLAAYCAFRQAEGYTARLTPSSLGRLQEFLQAEGVLSLPPLPQLPDSAEDKLLACFNDYLVHERGLVEGVVSRCVKVAALFIAEHPGLAVGGPAIGLAEISSFCVRELPRHSRATAPNVAAALRSFLRFLQVEGIVAAPLAQAVPRVADRKGTGVPRGLPSATVTRLLASCDRRTRLGRRDYAILLLLARLGMRAGEVAAMSLDDIDWRAGEFVVHGKGGRHDRLPLPDDVGAAVAGYLRRGRPRADSRAVFLRANAPIAGIDRRTITSVVYSACDRAGLPRVGAHRLRHTLASELLAAGSSLIEVGQILRHTALATTAIYAKVDHRALHVLVLPWPGGEA
jgi:integrase